MKLKDGITEFLHLQGLKIWVDIKEQNEISWPSESEGLNRQID